MRAAEYALAQTDAMLCIPPRHGLATQRTGILTAAINMPVEIFEGFGVVVNHGVEVEGLRVVQVGVGDGGGDGGPVGGEPAAEAGGVVAGAEVVVAGFGVALLPVEFVCGEAGADDIALAAVGRVVGVARKRS